MDKDVMCTLGQITRAIWPKTAEVPDTILDTILVAPLKGLGMASRTEVYQQADQEQLGDLMSKLPADLKDPPGGVSIADQCPFWLGYYHYADALSDARIYGPSDLAGAGQALYGDRWQTDLARDLGFSDGRRIRQWLSGDRPIPVGIWADLAGLLRHRQMSIQSVLNNLT